MKGKRREGKGMGREREGRKGKEGERRTGWKGRQGEEERQKGREGKGTERDEKGRGRPRPERLTWISLTEGKGKGRKRHGKRRKGRERKGGEGRKGKGREGGKETAKVREGRAKGRQEEGRDRTRLEHPTWTSLTTRDMTRQHLSLSVITFCEPGPWCTAQCGTVLSSRPPPWNWADNAQDSSASEPVAP